jgi:hypothetical protein
MNQPCGLAIELERTFWGIGDLMLDLARARDRVVDVQIARRGVRDKHVLEAMRLVPREAFVEPG